MAHMVCGQYGFAVWPIWLSVVAVIVLLWQIWFVVDKVDPLALALASKVQTLALALALALRAALTFFGSPTN